MKVVINSDLGGFGLSIEAQKKIAEIGCPHTKWVPENEYFRKDSESSDIKIWGSVEKARQGHCEFCGIPRENGKVLVDDHRRIYKNPIVRTCPALIKVIEEMGTKANGKHATLKIVEIPDNIEFEIEEYDGSEWVSEKHRTWR